MKRIFSATGGGPREGAVYRDLTACDAGTAVLEAPSSSSSSASSSSLEFTECAECFGEIIVDEITQPGCSSFPVSDNEYGTLPTSFPPDVEIDPFPYESEYETLATPSSSPVGPGYVDLWSQLSPELQGSILVPDCYCIGEGIDRPSLIIGRPAFPNVPPLPFFWVPIPPAGGGGGGVTLAPGEVPNVDQGVCPCDINQQNLEWELTETSPGVWEVALTGDIQVPYADYSGDFAGCSDGIGSVTLAGGRVYIDEYEADWAGGAVAVNAGDYVVLDFTWKWNDPPAPTIDTFTLSAQSTLPTSYRVDSDGFVSSQFYVILGVVLADLCFEQWQRGPITLEGVDIPGLGPRYSIEKDDAKQKLQLVNDVMTPANGQVYSVLSGVRNWNDIDEVLKVITGWTGTGTQILGAVNGTVQWIDASSSCSPTPP